jgi:hypothetical protein
MKTLALVAALAALATASTADARPLVGNAFAAAVAAAAAGAAAGASTSSGTGCQDDFCPKNGPQLTGIARPALEAKRPVVNAVILASGETVDLP